MDLEGPGVTTDSSGDKWFWVARRKAGDQEAGGGGAGRQEIVSGTGRGDMRERPGPVNTRWITWPITDLLPKSVASGKETSKTLQKSTDFIEVNKHRAMVFSDHKFEKIIDVQSNCHIVSQWVSVDSWRFDERFVQEGTYIFVLVVHNAERSYSSRFDAK